MIPINNASNQVISFFSFLPFGILLIRNKMIAVIISDTPTVSKLVKFLAIKLLNKKPIIPAGIVAKTSKKTYLKSIKFSLSRFVLKIKEKKFLISSASVLR